MPENSCALIHCRNKAMKGVTLHRFPSDEKLRLQWAKAAKITVLPKFAYLCSDHFISRDFFPRKYGSTRTRLLKTAVPSVNLKWSKSQVKSLQAMRKDVLDVGRTLRANNRCKETSLQCGNDAGNGSQGDVVFETTSSVHDGQSLSNHVQVRMPTLQYSSTNISPKEENYLSIHQCKTCPYTTKSWFLMWNHINRHSTGLVLFNCSESTPEIFFCKDCNFRTYQTVTFKEHIKKHNFTEIYLEEKPVSYKYYDENSLDKNTNGKILEWKCDLCSFRTDRKYFLMRHKSFKHPARLDDIKWFTCDQCLFKTLYKLSLKRHLKRKHGSTGLKRFFCEKCSFKTRYKTNLKSHMAFKHLMEKNVQWFFCSKCPYRTSREAHFNNHKHEEHVPLKDVKWFYCDKCPYSTKRKPDLKRHTTDKHTVLEDIEWIHCDKCSFKSKQTSTMRNHVKVKHRENITWIHCDKCSYKSYKKSCLKIHITRKHTAPEDIKWFYCDKCSSNFKLKSSLKTHQILKHSQVNKHMT